MIKDYHVKHNLNLTSLLNKAREVANYAVENKKKHFSTKEVKHITDNGDGIKLPSTITNQILRKYGRGTIKQVSNINLIVPNSSITKYKTKDGKIKEYSNIEYVNERIYIKPLNLSFRWNSGRKFTKINQVEIDNDKFMLTVSIEQPINNINYENSGILGLDLNCGVGRHIVNAANLNTGEVLNLGKQGPNIRKRYYKKRQSHKVRGDKEKRIMKDLDHKISRKIVNYALKNKLKIVVENLKGIRNGSRKGNGSKKGNRLVNSWSFYRLQTFIEYKSKELEIPFIKVNPHYTSQECSYCQVIGKRDRDKFTCNNKHCKSYKIIRHSDINAAFNVGKRSLQEGGRTQIGRAHV